MQERIQAWCVNSPHTITKGDVFSLLTDARFEVEETPKYDPCRLFKKGDVVKIRSVFGRKIYIDDVLYEVVWDESCNKISIKKLTSDETLVGMSSVFFELVTPVEELEPFSVQESEVVQGFDIVRDKLCVMSFPCGAKECGWYYNRLAAKEAAEAECARLNAEHRKEQA